MDIKNEYGTLNIQKELLDILELFHNFCDNNDIHYSLYGGSCLGAIRHKGFIPWDDDLDICVDSDNYHKLEKEFSKCDTLKMHKTIWIYRIQKPESFSINGYTPTLDVFCINNYPDNIIIGKLKLLLVSMLQGMLKENVRYSGFSFINKCFLFITHNMGKLFSKEKLRKWYDKASEIGNNKKTKYVHCTNTSFDWMRNLYPENTWDDYKLVDFENIKSYIPINYDSYLRICYGDYMDLPPVESRRAEHANI